MTLAHRIGPLVLALVSTAAAASQGAVDQAPAQVRYDDWRHVRAYLRSQEDTDHLRAIGAVLLSCREGNIPTDYALPPDAATFLAISGIPFEVLDDNIQDDIDAERALIALEAHAPRADDLSWWENFKDLGAIEAKLNEWLVARPDLVQVIDIGDSLEGRDIRAVRITGPGEGKPAVLFNGTQHAREWVSPMVNMYIAHMLIKEYDTNPSIRSLVDRVEIFIVPVVNPDGYEYSWQSTRLWRKNRRQNSGSNCDGVDLNRNWGVGWGSSNGSSGSACSEVYRGTAPFSEPETQAMRDFYLAHPEIVANVDFHAFSELILTPYGYTASLPPDHAAFTDLSEDLQTEISRIHGRSYEYGPAYTEIYPVSGGSIDWCYEDRGVFSMTVELRPKNGNGGGFLLPAGQIIPTCEENYAGAVYLAEWASRPVKFRFPDTLPQVLDAGEPTEFTVDVDVDFGEPLLGGTEKLFYRPAGEAPFSEVNLTALGGSLYRGTLPAVALSEYLEFYVEAQTTDGATHTSPEGAPAVAHEAVGGRTFYTFNLDVDPGWTTESEWEFGQPGGYGGQTGYEDPRSGYTGDNVYGYRFGGDYKSWIPEEHLTSRAIDCTHLSEVSLRFQRWLGVEHPSRDHASIRVSSDGTNWFTIWANNEPTLDDQWVQQDFDISQVADGQPTVYLRWTMGPTDGYLWACGWNVDDIELRAAGAASCTGDVNFDGVVNTNDVFGALDQWGWSVSPADQNADQVVDIDDIFVILGAWGPCP